MVIFHPGINIKIFSKLLDTAVEDFVNCTTTFDHFH